MKKEIKNEIITAFKNDDKHRVAELLLVKYYDIKYKKSRYDFTVNSNDINKAYDEILEIRDNIKITTKSQQTIIKNKNPKN